MMQKYEMPQKDADDIAAFLKPLFQFDTEKRFTAAQALTHPWITGEGSEDDSSSEFHNLQMQVLYIWYIGLCTVYAVYCMLYTLCTIRYAPHQREHGCNTDRPAHAHTARDSLCTPSILIILPLHPHYTHTIRQISSWK
jgi:serine/threonine protein kinase